MRYASHSCGAMGCGATKSIIELDMAGLGCFSKELLGKQMLIGYFSDALIHANLCGDKDIGRRYREGVMLEIRKSFRRSCCTSLMR